MVDATRFGLSHLIAWLAGGDVVRIDDAAASPARPFSTVTMSSLTTGSPPMQPGGLFVAIRGEKRDGHDFAAGAFANGAGAALVARVPDDLAGRVQAGEIATLDFRAGQTPPPDPLRADRPLLLLVDDPMAALQRCAAWWRRQHGAQVLAVAGSVGKTTTKELLAAIVERRFRTLRTPGSFNNELGLPFTLLKITPAHERVVLEIGISDIGEMRRFAGLAAAGLGVMTRIAAEHLHRLLDLDTVEREEGDLIAMLPADGVAVLNADDPRVARMARRTSARVVWFGERATAGVYATQVEERGVDGIAFRLHAGGESRQVQLPLVGRHFVTAALAAAAAAFETGCGWDDVEAGLARPPEAQRLAPLRLPDGVTLLDDTFNASPDSGKAALDALAALPGRRIAVLGDMFELGDYALEGHRLVGKHVPGRADHLLAVGDLGREIAAAARAAGMPAAAVRECASNAGAIAVLRDLLAPGDSVLVKGSHGMHMEEIVRALTAPPA